MSNSTGIAVDDCGFNTINCNIQEAAEKMVEVIFNRANTGKLIQRSSARVYRSACERAPRGKLQINIS